MKVLIWDSRKTDILVIDASTPEKEEAAFLYLFQIFDQDWKMYEFLQGEIAKNLYTAAKNGNANAAQSLLYIRKRQHHEYEDSWTLLEAVDPLKIIPENT